MTLTSIVAALAALAFSDTPGNAGPPPAVAEYFLVTEEATDEDAVEGAPIAVVALRSINPSMDSIDVSGDVKFLLEREVTFAKGGLRVRHTESGHGATRRLVWREFLPNESRTWVADWTAGVRGAEAQSIGYGWNRPVHERVMVGEASDTTVFGPLELLYRTREASLPCGESSGAVGVVDPVSASIVQVSRSAVALGVAAPEVEIDLRRPDGTLLLGATASAQSVGDRGFRALRLSDRPTLNVRIERQEFERLTRLWTVESRRPYDAVLAQIPKRR